MNRINVDLAPANFCHHKDFTLDFSVFITQQAFKHDHFSERLMKRQSMIVA
jgi:hypothetical protein